MPVNKQQKASQAMFKDKVVAITGAARGIGEALTRAFLAEGAHVVALDLYWQTDAPLYRDLLDAGSLPLACDITSDEQVDNAFRLAIERFKTIDVLVNNAAMRQRDFYPLTGACAVLDTTDEHWVRMYQVNVVGTLKVIRRFIEPMRAQRSGSVINVSANGSLVLDLGAGVSAGNHPEYLNQPYDASKAALTSLSFYLAAEVKTQNVAVNVVFPGPTRTTGSDELTDGRKGLGFMTQLLGPDHVVPVCLHLAAQNGQGVTGRAFDVVPWNAALQAVTHADAKSAETA